jgi:ribonucleoside-diphosphate reductase alpha chain
VTTTPEGKTSSPGAPPGSEQTAQLRPRPHLWYGATYRVSTPVGTAFVTVNSDAHGNIREVFVTVGRAGSDVAADAEAIGRLISLVLSVPSRLPPRQVVEAVIDQLSGIGGSSALAYGPKRIRSLADAVAQVLAEHIGIAGTPVSEVVLDHSVGRETDPNRQGVEETDVSQSGGAPSSTRGRTGDFCPNCGQMALVNEEGCRKCYNCGFSSC